MSLDSEVVILSSDDEFDSPPHKKQKINCDIDTEILHKLTRLKEITTAVCLDGVVNVKKKHKEENRITIVIPDEISVSKESDNCVVSLIDESPDVTFVPEQKDISGECLVLGSDSEAEENVENCKVPQSLEESKGSAQNGTVKEEEIIEESKLLKEKEIVSVNGRCDLPSDSSQEQEKEIDEELPVENEDILNRPSTSTASEAHKLLDEFLEVCTRTLRGSQYESKVSGTYPKMKRKFDECERIHNELHFRRMLQEHISSARVSPGDAVVSYQRVFAYLLDHVDGDTVEVEEKELVKLRKLEKTCKRLLKRLHILENAEINFDDEGDSTFIQIDRYSRRLNQVYNKYCQLLKKNAHAGRLLYEKIQFVSSKYNEINRAVTKSYKHNKFPTYYEVEKCVRKCVEKHALSLTESEIREESKSCFTKMGNLLQMRRKKELYEVHCGFITNEDPADQDDALKAKLQESLQEGEQKMKKLVESYVRMQEDNVNVEVSEDSDDSNYKESESETEERNA